MTHIKAPLFLSFSYIGLYRVAQKPLGARLTPEKDVSSDFWATRNITMKNVAYVGI